MSRSTWVTPSATPARSSTTASPSASLSTRIGLEELGELRVRTVSVDSEHSLIQLARGLDASRHQHQLGIVVESIQVAAVGLQGRPEVRFGEVEAIGLGVNDAAAREEQSPFR